MSLSRIRIVNNAGLGYATRVWLNDVEISASLARLAVDVNDVVTVTLTMPHVAVEYEGEAEVDLKPKVPHG